MIAESRDEIETVDVGSHTYVITKNSSSPADYQIEVRGLEGAYSIGRIPVLSSARQVAATAPAPTAELDGAALVAGRDDKQVWHVFTPDTDTTGGLEANRLYGLSALPALRPVEHFPIPDIRILARDETESSFEGTVTAAFGRVITIYGVNLSDDTYYDKSLYFLQNEAEIIDDEEGMDAIAALAGYDSYTQFQYDDAGESALSVSSFEIDKMEVVDTIHVSPQWAVEFALESSEKIRDDMLMEGLQAYCENGLPEVSFEGGRRSAEEIRSASRSTNDPTA